MTRLTIGKPNPKQKEFFYARKRYVGYGGARGGGKSWAIRAKATMLALKYPGIRCLVLRRTYPELYENFVQPMAMEIAPAIRDGFCRYKKEEKAFNWSNGSRIVLGYCDNDSDILRYQGIEYDVIFLDEATQWPESWYQILTACLRGANDKPKRFYLTCNPGGIGHTWVKRLFIDRDYKPEEDPQDYCFIQAKVWDNAVLMEKDPGYLKRLQALPEKIRKGWLDGEWDLFDGQYFGEFKREKHVVEPFHLPEWWRRYVTMDYGLDMLAVYWIALDEKGEGFVYRELYEGRDNQKGTDGRGHIISSAAARIMQMTPAGEKVEAWLAPPDLWNRNRDTGRSTAEIFAEHGIQLTKTSNDRVAGWRATREWLADIEDEQGGKHPKLRIFSTCQNLIRTLPALQFDEKNPEDVAIQPHELTHAPDALRGFCVYWTAPASKPEPENPAGIEQFYSTPNVTVDEILGWGDDIDVI